MDEIEAEGLKARGEMMSILCAGFFPALQRTLLFDQFRPHAVNRARRVEYAVGGKAVNTASVLKTLDMPVMLMGFSGGATGAQMESIVAARHIPSTWVQANQAVRICQTIRVEGESDFTELIEEGPVLSEMDWARFLDVFKEQVRHASIVVMSGTVPPTAPEDVYASMIALCRDDQCVVLDTSGPALLAALEVAGRVIVKINVDELLRTVPGNFSSDSEKDVGGAANRLLDRGAFAVGVTDGAETAYLATADGLQSFAVPQVNVQSALGSGDAVNAGLAARLWAGDPLEKAFAYGIACGSANALTPVPGVLEPQQVEKLLEA